MLFLFVYLFPWFNLWTRVPGTCCLCIIYSHSSDLTAMDKLDCTSERNSSHIQGVLSLHFNAPFFINLTFSNKVGVKIIFQVAINTLKSLFTQLRSSHLARKLLCVRMNTRYGTSRSIKCLERSCPPWVTLTALRRVTASLTERRYRLLIERGDILHRRAPLDKSLSEDLTDSCWNTFGSDKFITSVPLSLFWES